MANGFGIFTNYYDELNSLIDSILNEGKSLYNDKEYILNRLIEKREKLIKDLEAVMTMMYTTGSSEAEIELDRNRRNIEYAFNTVKSRIDRYIMDSVDDSIKLDFLIKGFRYDKDRHLKIPDGTTHVLYHGGFKHGYSLEDCVNTYIEYLKINIPNISYKTLEDCKQLMIDSALDFVISISDDYVKITLPKSLVFFDKYIFSWILSIKEIECYRNQLGIVEQAIEYNKQSIDRRLNYYLKTFNNLTEEELNKYKDIKITLLD